MTNFITATKMSEPRELTPAEQAVTDIVAKFSDSNAVLKLQQLDQIEQHLDDVVTVRELLTSSRNLNHVRSARLEILTEAFNLLERVVKALPDKTLPDSLKQLRNECLDEFLKIAGEAANFLCMMVEKPNE